MIVSSEALEELSGCQTFQNVCRDNGSDLKV